MSRALPYPPGVDDRGRHMGRKPRRPGKCWPIGEKAQQMGNPTQQTSIGLEAGMAGVSTPEPTVPERS